jgi:heat induced stress protein YflT
MAEHTAQRDLDEPRAVAGLFAEQASAEQAIHALKAAGFAGEQIGVAMRDRTAQGVLIEEAQAAEGATAGALGGGLLGGLTGLLIGIGALAVPGFWPVVAGGVLASAFGIAGGTALAGAGLGAAAGGVVGALMAVGIPEPAARHFETGVRAGRVLVTVEAGARVLEAMAILDRHGADTGPATGPGAVTP